MPHAGGRMQRFALVGAASVLALILFLSYFTHDTAVNAIGDSGVAQHESLAKALARFHHERIAALLRSPVARERAALEGNWHLAMLRDALLPLMRELGVLRVKLYDRDGRVMFSDVAELLGEQGSDNEGWRAAMAGRVASKIIHRDTFNASDGVVENRDLLETYVPVVPTDGGEALGVFEIYSDLTPLLADMQRAHDRLIWGALAISGLFMTLLALLYRRTSASLSAEQALNARYVADLETARATLEGRVAERTAELAHSEQRLRDVIDTSGAYIWETDREGRFTYVSEPVVDVLGWRPEELLGRTPVSLMPPEDGERVRCAVAEIGPERPFRGIEHRSRTRDGSLVWLRANGLPYYDADGRRLGTRGAALDISVEREASQLAERFARVLEQTEDAVLFCDREGRIEHVNPAFTRATGYTLEEVRGRTPALLQSGETPASVFEDMWRTLVDGRSWRGEMRNRAKDGRVYWDQVVISPVRDADGEIRQFVGTQVNITARKEREIALRDSEARLRTVMASVVDGIISIDESGRIEMCNVAAERLFGYAASELVGRDISMLMPEPYRGEHARYLARYVRGGKPRIVGVGGREVLGLRRDGSTFALELSVGEMRLGEQRKFVGVLRDLAERKRAEQELEHARQQYLHREKMAAIGQFAAGIIHEVGNPVTAIVGAVEELHRLRADPDGDPRDLDRVTAEQLDLISDHALRIARITREISGFATPQSAESTLLSVNEVVRASVRLLRFDRRARDVRFVLALDDELPAIETSADHLTQVLLNLLINAADACNVADVASSVVEVGTHRHEDHVEVYVRDNGVGMDTDTLAHAFEPYFTTKTGGDGLGLGLSLSDALVREHGGHFEVVSRPGEGTTMRVFLPLAPAAVAEPVP